MKTYQAHEGEGTGVSDSHKKTLRLQIPADLKGKRVLDIGCNEGYFSNLAIQRGASRVVGIDFVKSNIEFAQQNYKNERLQFIHQDWSSLPDETFDLVIWSSAMHYEMDPKSVIGEILKVLSPNGLLILECGVVSAPGKTFLPWPRVADTRWYPTYEFLTESILTGFSVREMSPPEIAFGDYVPRVVFHCKPLVPSVILIAGETNIGKSTVARLLSVGVDKTINLDLLITRMGLNKHPHDDFEKFMVSCYDPSNLGIIYQGIDREGFSERYIDLLTSAVAKTDRVVIFEGYMTDAQIKMFSQRLSGRANVWHLDKS